MAFIITNYSPPDITASADEGKDERQDTSLISPHLSIRLNTQEALKTYLEGAQILSWYDGPSTVHTSRLNQLAELEPNPTGMNCVLL